MSMTEMLKSSQGREIKQNKSYKLEGKMLEFNINI